MSDVEPDYHRILARLRDAADRLALGSADQIAWLKALGTGPLADELGLDFDQWAEFVPELQVRGLVPGAAVLALSRLSDELGRH